MGSYAKATMVGFMCRLCAKPKKNVIHIYSAKGRRMELHKKLTSLPLGVKKYDNLPKILCDRCIERMNSHYEMLEKRKRPKRRIVYELRDEADLHLLLRNPESVQEEQTATNNPTNNAEMHRRRIVYELRDEADLHLLLGNPESVREEQEATNNITNNA